MLTMDDIRRHAFKRRLKNMELVRLDYLQDVILFILYTQISPGILFKGGTAIWKLMKGERFSEDLDLEFDKKTIFGGELAEYLMLWGFNVDIVKEKITSNAYYVKVKASAETFKTSEISIESVFRGRDGITLPFNSPYPDIPVFDVKTLPPDEMAREKLEAVMSRNKARDLFDLYILLKNYGVTLKCGNPSELEKKIDEKKEDWDTLALFVTRKLPPFTHVKEFVISRLLQK